MAGRSPKSLKSRIDGFVSLKKLRRITSDLNQVAFAWDLRVWNRQRLRVRNRPKATHRQNLLDYGSFLLYLSFILQCYLLLADLKGLGNHEFFAEKNLGDPDLSRSSHIDSPRFRGR